MFPWVALVFGLCVGSFLNVVIHRLPKMMERELARRVRRARRPAAAARRKPPYNLVRAALRLPGLRPSHPRVGEHPARELARRCAASARPAARASALQLSAGRAARRARRRVRGLALRRRPLAALGAALFIWFTIALAFIDQETGYLPDDLTLPLVWMGLLVNLGGAFVPLADAVIGAAAGYLSLWLVYQALQAASPARKAWATATSR